MMERKFGTIIQIGDILVSEDVVTEYFACDYEVCRGACCIVGDSGAPMEEDEPEMIERDYPRFSALMSEGGRAAAEASGFFEIDRDGDIVTPLVKGSCECAFCHSGPCGETLCEAGVVLALSYKGHEAHRRLAGPQCPSLGHLQACLREGSQGRRAGLPVSQEADLRQVGRRILVSA